MLDNEIPSNVKGNSQEKVSRLRQAFLALIQY